MTRRERILATFNREKTDRCPFWKGSPISEEAQRIADHFNIGTDNISLSEALNDDMVWLMAEEYCWKHPEGKPFLDIYQENTIHALSSGGVFVNIESIDELDDFEWPNLDYLDFTEYRRILIIAREKGLATAGGFWSPFFHQMMDFLGMENYFIKMFTHPELVKALTDRVVDLYLEANRRCFEAVGDLIDIFFFGNDFGSQQDLLVSPQSFDDFILPSFQKLVDMGKSYDKKVLLHSCGSIHRVIPQLIKTGIDGLHPLQALAHNMDPQSLLEFKDDIIFVGAVDAQNLLPYGTPDEIRCRIAELKDILGPGFIISPSHEALMLDVSIDNVIALCEAATGIPLK